LFGFLMGEALRDLRRAGRVAVGAVVLITLSLVAASGFWLLSTNLGRAVAEWQDRGRIIVYLKREPPASDVATLLARVREHPEVAGARYVNKADALAELKRVLGKDAAVAESLPGNPLPASIEVTLTAAGATPDAARDLIARLRALPEVEDVEGGVAWVEWLADARRLLAWIGLGVGAVLVLAAILTVTTATTLVLHARQRETEIMRLVGAPEAVIRLPLLLQGMAQGLLGAGLALLALIAAHRMAAPWLEPLMNQTLGLPRLEFLTPPAMLGLLLAGAMLGGLGGWLARGRRGVA
jgi:cell division transport system permease protein